jgi:hypothetical protein
MAGIWRAREKEKRKSVELANVKITRTLPDRI